MPPTTRVTTVPARIGPSRALACAAGVLALLALFIGTGSVGQDWQRHWDEEALVAKVRWSIENGGTLLPRTYDWPGVSYDLALAALAPAVLSLPPSTRTSITSVESALLTSVDSPEYRLRLRRLFLAITALSLVWVVLAVVAGDTAGVALLAAALIALSWQVAYHARWAAPDGVLMQFGTLALAAAAWGIRTRAGWAWTAAAAAAGAAVGAKYSAWPLVAAVMVSAWAAGPRERGRLALAVRLGLVAVGVFFVTTPGALLQPVLFVSGLTFQWGHYTTGHKLNTVDAGLPHLAAMLQYLTAEVWSTRWPASVALALMALPGAVRTIRTNRPLAVLLVGFPVFYVLYLSAHRVLMARNLLPVVPCLAVLVAAGIAACWNRWPTTGVRLGIALAVGVILADNAYVLVRAAESRQSPSLVPVLTRLAEDITRQTDAVTCATTAVLSAFKAEHVAAPSRLASSCAGAERVVFRRGDAPRLPAVGTARYAVYAPAEVDYRYYADWAGFEPFLLASLDEARRMGVSPH